MAYPAMLVIAGLMFFSRLWKGGGIIYSPFSDIIASHAGVKRIGQEALLRGHLPLWDPSCNGGAPAWAAPESMYTSPLHLGYFFLPLGTATNLAVLLGFLCAGLSMYLLSRRLFEHPGACFFSGLGYMLCYRFLSHLDAGWLPSLGVYALTPLLFWAAEKFWDRPRRTEIFLLAGVSAAVLVQGNTQLVYFLGLCVCAHAAYRAARRPHGGRLVPLAALAASGVLGLMLAAPDLLPRLEFALLSPRLQGNAALLAASAPGWAQLRTLFDPLDGGGTSLEYWERNFYFGLWLLPLALVSLRSDRRSLALAAAWAFLVTLCFATPLLALATHLLPGFALFPHVSRTLFVSQFLVTLLAARGLDRFLSGRAQPVDGWWLAGLVLGAGFLGVAVGPRATIPLTAACDLLLLAGVAASSRLRRPALLLAAACCALTLDVGARMLPRIRVVPEPAAFVAHPLHDQLRRSTTSGRTAAVGRNVVPYGMAGYFGIDLVNGYASLSLKHFLEYFDVMKHGAVRPGAADPGNWTDLDRLARPELLRALDVRHVVANELLPLEDIGFAKTSTFVEVPVFDFYVGYRPETVHVWEDRRPLGPAFFATSAFPVADESRSLAALAGSPSVRDAQVWAEPGNLAGLDFTGGSARMFRDGLAAFSYEIESMGQNFLIISQVWYPGWRARLDGVPLPVYRTDHALLGCRIPPGRHRLELTMTSPRLLQGLALFLAALAIMAFSAVSGRRCGRPEKDHD